MDLSTGNNFDDVFLTDPGGQLTVQASEATGLAESTEEERVRYERVIRELNDFEVAREYSIDSALGLPSDLVEQHESEPK